MPLASHEYEDVLENTDVSNIEDYDSFEQVSPDRFEESNIEDYDNFEQVSPERKENVMKFPNEAYADLMELVIKYNLNNKTENAIIKFFDKHSNLSTSFLPKNIEADQKLMDIMNSDGETLYNATTTDSLGKSSLHLIYISLRNIRTWRRNKEDTKQLLGYLPILSANNEGDLSD
ncbi:hypothetical protein Glove_134g3 [Diversispora epigaea]|uniref:Uncharacterized protein n=1 Tax=Diversispora epigaea TaxID=1348612 RepID=A0A397J6T9_9GLOM|nr:hypothetical protein Glove_134g3 [Diversispora epigaea]